MSEWSTQLPKENGVYLTKFDEDDDDSEATTYHVKSGKFYKPTGEQWICFGGIWKRVGDLPSEPSGISG